MSKYKDWLAEDKLILLEGWSRNLTDEQIANNIGISRSTLSDWKTKYSDISDALKRGKEVIDFEVENKLLKRALGFTYDEVTKERIYDEEKKEYKMVETKRVTKQVVPDTTAQIFWLKNRKPNQWRDRQQLEHSGEINNPLREMTTDEIKQEIENLKNN